MWKQMFKNVVINVVIAVLPCIYDWMLAVSFERLACNVTCNRKLKISKVPTNAKLREPAYSQAY